jgi:hypothetical protein
MYNTKLQYNNEVNPNNRFEANLPQASHYAYNQSVTTAKRTDSGNTAVAMSGSVFLTWN